MLFFLTGAQSKFAEEARIVGGESVNIKNYNYQASVRYGGQHICGGSILKSNYILTAAHCTHK